MKNFWKKIFGLDTKEKESIEYCETSSKSIEISEVAGYVQFIAPTPIPENTYFDYFLQFLNSFEEGKILVQDFSLITEINETTSDEIITHLLNLACDAQNGSNINIGRYYLQTLPKDWILERVERLIEPLLQNGDYWNYDRALELFWTLDFSLAKKLALRASLHSDWEIREMGIEFLEM